MNSYWGDKFEPNAESLEYDCCPNAYLKGIEIIDVYIFRF